MSTAIITVKLTNPDREDKTAMDYLIGLENTRITTENEQLSQQDPPGTPLPLLPNATNQERNDSYEIILSKTITNAHADYIRQAVESVVDDPEFKDLKPFWKDATSQQKAAAKAALLG